MLSILILLDGWHSTTIRCKITWFYPENSAVRARHSAPVESAILVSSC